tara:strand:- start:826 stop:1326 length:501 start_codon:yes stop_codon:yes gene_type:complete
MNAYVALAMPINDIKKLISASDAVKTILILKQVCDNFYVPDDLIQIIMDSVKASFLKNKICRLFNNYTTENGLYDICGCHTESMIMPFIQEDHCPYEYIEDPYDEDDNTMVVDWNELKRPSPNWDYPMMVKFLKYAMERGLDEKSLINGNYELWREDQDDYIARYY